MAPLGSGSWRGLLRVIAAAGALLFCVPAIAQPTDTLVKAAFLPRFARYVTWPPAGMPKGSDPFLVCVVGSDPFGAMLDETARSQSIDGRRVAVRRMDSAAGADSCQIAFVAGSRAPQLIAELARKPVLTVTDAANGSSHGMIHFVIVDGRVRFFIDQAAAVQRGLSISSRLLALAVGVRQ